MRFQKADFRRKLSLLEKKRSKVLDINKHRALVTDINFKAQLTGWEVARRARELSPEIPVIYMTGAAASEWPSLGVPNSVLLNKPFAAAQLVTAVAQMLNTVDQSPST